MAVMFRFTFALCIIIIGVIASISLLAHTWKPRDAVFVSAVCYRSEDALKVRSLGLDVGIDEASVFFNSIDSSCYHFLDGVQGILVLPLSAHFSWGQYTAVIWRVFMPPLRRFGFIFLRHDTGPRSDI